MKNLFYKELKLAVHPTMWLFFALSAMVLIPQYPYYLVFFYSCLAVFFTCLRSRENRDFLYTALLPVSKRDVVRARFLTVAFFQLLQMLVTVPFAVWSLRHNPAGSNSVGIECNAAFFGLSALMLGGFNLCFLPPFYKTAQKLGWPLFYGGAFVTLYIAIAETLVHIPGRLSAFLDSKEPEVIKKQLPVLLGGLLLYGLLTLLAMHRSEKNFEKVSL